MNPLVSIIIPTYNREHLIGETLDSILKQTYSNWECIIVDDRSTDSTSDLLENYSSSDKRFLFFIRPEKRIKGANSCRNIGLNKAKGAFIVFFDSDDLMTPDHLEVKVKGIQKGNYDYVITRTQYFNYDNDQIDRYYKFDEYEITAENYITQKINWLTLDVCIKKSLAKNISFNEQLQSGQEYNYFSKLSTLSVNTLFINKVVSLRRHHKGSIRSQINTTNKSRESTFKKYLFTYVDIKKSASIATRHFLINQCIKIVYRERKVPGRLNRMMIRSVFTEYNRKGYYFIMMLFFLRYFNKGYYFLKKFNLNEQP